MAFNQTNKIVWIVDTIKRAGRISFHDINELWKANECLGAGTDLSKRSLHKWIDVIFDTFGIIISNEGRGEYCYYIENPDVIENGSIEHWLFSMNSVSNLSQENVSLHDRIILESIPSSERILTPIMDAMKENHRVRLITHDYLQNEDSLFIVEPYLLRLWHQRWYMFGRVLNTGEFRRFCLDRILEIQLLEDTFTMPTDFNAEDFFHDCYGVMRNPSGSEVTSVRIRATALQANYIRDLPLHTSQQEIERNDEYSIFNLYIRPTYDFYQEVLRMGTQIEILEPIFMREILSDLSSNIYNKYRLHETTMSTSQTLLETYQQVREQNKETSKLGVITNPNAVSHGIMLVGLNPSTSEDCDKTYNYEDCHGDFWDPKHSMMGKYDERTAYIDLFPVRNGKQKSFENEIEKSVRYYGMLLSHTQDYIEDIAPKLVIYANATTLHFWGKGYGWMGYEFERVESPLKGDKGCWPLYRIKGITPSNVNRHRNTTNLDGSYFLHYRQHKDAWGRVITDNKIITEDDIEQLIEFISMNWREDLIK